MIVISPCQSHIQKRLVLAAMTCCLSCIFLDTSLIPIALPTLQKQMGFSGLIFQWILNIFYISTAIFVIFAGKLADIFGKKKIFCIGSLLYAAGSLIAGLARTAFVLLIGRTLQGIGSALMIPSALAILSLEFPAQKLGKALGLGAGISSIFLVIGPFLSGFLIENFSWRLIFFIEIAFCLAGLILTALFVPKGGKIRAKIDFKGVILLILGLGFLLFGLMNAKYWGWSSPWLLNYTLTSIVILTALYYHSKLSDFPILDFNLFHIRTFLAGTLLGFISQFTTVYTAFVAIFFQKGLGLTPIQSGIYLVAANLPIVFFSPIAGIMVDRFGTKIPLKSGLVLLIFSMLLFMGYTWVASQSLIFSALVVFGMAQSLIATPIGSLTLVDVPSQKKGVAAGIYNTAKYLGSAVGIVCLGWIGYFFRIWSLNRQLQAHDFSQITDGYKIEDVIRSGENLSFTTLNQLKLINNKSIFISFNSMSFCISLFALVGLLLTFVYLNDYKENERA